MIQRGEIYFVSLDPTRGREQAGRRPVLVVSVDSINRLPLVITVVPGTDSRNIARDYPTNVRIAARESGLPVDTVFMCYQVRALDHDRFQTGKPGKPEAAGRVAPRRLREVEAALRMSLGL